LSINEANKPGIHYEFYSIPPAGTHNTLFPFTLKMGKGFETTIHVIKVVGKKLGPKLYLGSGVHGEEINGIEVALRVPREIEPKKIRGELVIVPVQNPAAYLFRVRLNPYDPIDPA